MNLTALLWGFAEGTLFFFVPDVFLSAAGLVDTRKSIIACFYALAGSLLGGSVMYFWGTVDVAGALRVLDFVPGISSGMIDSVHSHLTDSGVWGLFRGPWGGVPYKIYAVQAHSTQIGLAPFLLISIPVRLGRFLVVTVGAPFLVRKFGGDRSFRWNLVLLLGAWIVFYVFYFIGKGL